MIRAMHRLRDLIGPQSWARCQRTYILAALAALLETASIAAIFPIVTGIAAAREGTVAQGFSVGTAVMFLGSLYLAGLLLRAFALHQSAKTNLTEGFRYSARLFQRTLEQPYEWNFSNHSADLRSAILSDAQDLISAVFTPLGRVISQMTLVAAVTCVLLVLQPAATLIFGSAISIIYLVTFTLLRGPLKRDGERQMTAHQQRHRLSAEAFLAGRELRLSHLEDRFAQSFTEASDQLARAATNRSIYTELPKLMLEAIIFGLLAWFAVHNATNDDVLGVGSLPTLVLFAAAGLKLFPIGHLIFANLAVLRSGWPIVGKFEMLERGLKPVAAIAPCPPVTHRFALENVSFNYPGNTGPALGQISFAVQPGQKVAIVGPSGSGKSTLIDLIAGLLQPTSGDILIDGTPRQPAQCRDWQRQVRYSPQTPTIFDQSLTENITFGADYPPEQVLAAIHIACLGDTVAGKLAGLDALAGEQGRNLSGGQLKRIGIARAFLDDVPVYLLDEPTSNLDPETAAMVMTRALAARPNAIFFIVTHDQTLANQCDTIVDLGRPAGVVGQ